MGSPRTTPSLILPGHPLGKDVAGCWLFNEGSGNTLLDASGYRHTWTLNGPTWEAGKSGPALRFNGSSDYASMVDQNLLDVDGTSGVTLLARVKTTCAIDQYILNKRVLVGWNLRIWTGGYILGYWKDAEADALSPTADGVQVNDGQWHDVALVYDHLAHSMTRYADGQQTGTVSSNASFGNAANGTSLYLGMNEGSTGYFSGSMEFVYFIRRALSASEIAWLYREPFAFLHRPGLPGPAIVAGGVTHDLAGSIAAASDLSASAKVSRNISGQVSSVTSLWGALSVTSPGPEATLENASAWRSAILSNGLTPTASKLGTVLTGGWFWTRRAGCSAIYRGPSLADVDFHNILSVVDRDAQQVSVPTYLSHEPGSSYCYVVRRFNGSGDLEQTTAAAVLARIGADGRLADPAPNGVFGLNAAQIANHKMRLLWFYCPLDQQIAPEGFNVYWDSGSGQIDFTEPLAEVPYSGRKCYCYVSDGLADGTYRFAVRAGCENQAESMSLSLAICSIQTRLSQAMTILAAEAIR